MTGIIFLLNLEYAPFIKKYTAELEAKGEKFEVIFWERLESDFSTPWKTILYKKRGNLGDNKIIKLITFMGFRRFLLKKLKQKKYEKLIVLTTLTGMLIGDYLVKNYKGKFIFDIRDYTFEKNFIFKLLEKVVIKASCFTAISSEAFKEFLPKDNKYVLSHNIILDEVSVGNEFMTNKNIEEINLTFIGAVRHYDIDKKVVDTFGNDVRYKVFFHGYGVSYNDLNNYCKKQYNNVFFTGKYDRKDKTKLLQNTTVINSYYSSDNYANKYALPNKYYDALIYHIPLWANPDVYVGKRAIECGVGINVKLNNEAPNNMYSILKSIDWEEFYKRCSLELKRILDEDKDFVNKLHNFINMR